MLKLDVNVSYELSQLCENRKYFDKHIVFIWGEIVDKILSDIESRVDSK